AAAMARASASSYRGSAAAPQAARLCDSGLVDFIHLYRAPATPGGPILLLLHGTGGNEHDLVPLADTLLPGAGILSPRGNVLERGMPRFFRRLAEGVFDLEDLTLRTAELADFITAAAAKYTFATRDVTAAGFSN